MFRTGIPIAALLLTISVSSCNKNTRKSSPLPETKNSEESLRFSELPEMAQATEYATEDDGDNSEYEYSNEESDSGTDDQSEYKSDDNGNSSEENDAEDEEDYDDSDEEYPEE